MNFSEFSKSVKEFFEKFLQRIYEDIKASKITIKGKYSFPSYLRIGESPYHWMAELLGVFNLNDTRKYQIEDPPSSEKFKNTSTFFNPGRYVDDSMESVLNIGNVRYMGFINLCISTKYDLEIFKKYINYQISSTQLRYYEADVPITIQPDCKSILFYNVDLIRTEDFKLYFKSIPTAIAVQKTFTQQQLLNWLSMTVKNAFNDSPCKIIGLNIGYSYSSEKFTHDLMSLTNQKVKEVVIDKFIQKHVEFFQKALGYKDSISQANLKIIEKDDFDKESLKPDYLMQRKDGFYDIVDLKTSALKYKSITKGPKRRKRFNNYVSELLAQLIGYERYFKSRKNSEWAFQKYGIKIKNLKLIGIVGNYQNFDRYKVDLALEQYKDNIAILSYSDLINLLRKVESN